MSMDTAPALTSDDRVKLDGILLRNGRRPELLIQVLQDMQVELGYLPEDGLAYVAEHLDVPVPRVFHVATFYKAFSLKPRGQHVLNVCRGTACHVRGSERLVETVQRELGVRDGETTADRLFTLECVNCIGACALGPAVVVDGVTFARVTPDRFRKIIEGCRAGTPPEPEGAPQAAEAPAVPQAAEAAAAPKPAGPSTKKLRRIERRLKREVKRTRKND